MEIVVDLDGTWNDSGICSQKMISAMLKFAEEAKTQAAAKEPGLQSKVTMD